MSYWKPFSHSSTHRRYSSIDNDVGLDLSFARRYSPTGQIDTSILHIYMGFWHQCLVGYCDRNFLDHVPLSFKERTCLIRGRLQLFPAFSECLKQRRERHRVYLQQRSNEQRDLLANGRVKLPSFVCLFYHGILA